MMNSKTILCVDIGTTALKAALITDKGSVLHFTRQIFFPKNKNTISLEWLNCLKKGIQYFSIQTNINQSKVNNSPLQIDAICISGNGPTIISEDGTTLLWNDDIESVVKDTFKNKQTNSLFIPRLVAFKKLFLEEWNKSKYIFSGPEFVVYKLTGTPITILPESRYISAYWTDEMLSSFDIPSSKLPPFVNLGSKAATLLPSVAEEYNLPKGIPVISGGPDFVVAMIGTNTLTPGKLCDCAGSSEGINFCTEKPLCEEGVRTLPSVVPGLWNAALLMESSGRRFVECKENYESNLKNELSYSQYISLCLDGTEENGNRILNEINSFVKNSVKRFYDIAQKNNLPISDYIMITGGQAKNDLWLQKKSDTAKIKFCVTKTRDAELIGDAVVSMVALGEYQTIQDSANVIVQNDKVFYPNEDL